MKVSCHNYQFECVPKTILQSMMGLASFPGAVLLPVTPAH